MLKYMTALLPLDSSSLFSEIAGLPMHPLIVHIAVVFLPVSALALVVLAFRPRWAQRYGWLAVAGTGVATVAAFVSRASGEALAERIGRPSVHADYGTVLPFLALALLVLSVLWLVTVKRTADSERGGGLRLAAGVVMSLVALGTVGLTALVGHSGAESVWGGVVASATAPVDETSGEHSHSHSTDSTTPTPAPTSSAPTSGPTSSTPVADATYTMDDVAAHADASSCWAAIDGNVYDLTGWIALHPGGSHRIIPLCGTDATAAFQQQHSGDERPAAELEGFLLGPLA